MIEKPNQKTVELLKALDNYSDPIGPAAQLETERLMRELRKAAAEDKITTYRMAEDGPEQTAAEILAELDADATSIGAMRRAIGQV